MRRDNINLLRYIFILFFIFLIFSNSALYGQSNLSNTLKKFNGSTGGVKAAFGYSPIIIVAGLDVRFIDKSNGNPNYRLWNFGDGIISYEQNPTHIYDKAGVYTVSLTVRLDGASSTITKKIRVYASKATTNTATKTLELTPSFEFSPLTPEVGMTVQFTDSSTGNPTSWQWDFGDGSQSTQQNPQHQYQNAGTYNVTLTISNGTSSKNLTKSINVLPLLNPGFSYLPANPEVGESIQFQDTSSGNPSSWSWNFGDGATSSVRNPSHTYSSVGTYTVTLQVSNGTYTKSTSKSITVLIPLTVDFAFSPSAPLVNQDVQFTNQTSGSVNSYLWNFGDGSTSTAKDPIHKFTSAGSFTVTLTATNAKGSKTKSKTVVVSQALNPSFTYSPSSPYAGQTVQFTDTSTGNPTSWQWDFGDGSSSSIQNPTHVYSTTGTYTVTLRVTNSAESKTTSKTITVKPVVRADFSFSPTNPTVGTSVQFTDKSTGNITSWSWKFGDGATSTQKNPAHAYSSAGSYNVTLTVSDGTTSNSMTQTITVQANIVADFTYSPSSPVVGQEVQFLDNSQGSPTSWSWDFGDGAKSTSKNPTHTYSQTGTFSVKLTVSDGVNSNTTTKPVSVTNSSKRVITAASPALADIQAAISQANPGDTVVVPNGTVIWQQQLVINKGVILKAATKGGVTLIADFEAPEYSFSNYMIQYYPSNALSDDPFRVSGFIFDCNHKTQGVVINQPDYTTKLTKIRIDNNTFKNGDLDGCKYLAIYGRAYGVADNNFFDGSDSNTAWRYVSCMDSSNGRYVWQYYTFEFGTEDNFYFEDNTFYIGAGMAIMGGAGGRYSFRYNNVTFSASGTTFVSLFDTHGNMGSGGNWSHIGCEFYGNTINLNGRNFRVGDARGGKHVIYNNQYINDASHYGQTFREEYHDSLNPPARHLISQQPQYISETYSWNEYVNGSKKLPIPYRVLQTIDYGGDEGIIPREDYNFFLEKSNFNGSSGIGVGLLSQRPTYCSLEGAAWWATDENKLYRWHNGRWELYYVPYTYPHPLRNILGR